MRILLLVVMTAFLPAAANAQAPVKIGYADVEYIISQLPETKNMEEQVTATRTRLEEEYNLKSTQFRKDYTAYVEGMNTMTDTLRANTEKALQQASAELRQMEADAQRTIQNQQKLLLAPVYLKVSKAIDDVAVEKGFGIILSRRISGSNLFLFAAGTSDISDLVVRHLAPEKN